MGSVSSGRASAVGIGRLQGSREHTLPGLLRRIGRWFGGQGQRARAAGVDGARVNFYDFGPELDRFARTVPPRMREAGLRAPEPDGLENTGSEG